MEQNEKKITATERKTVDIVIDKIVDTYASEVLYSSYLQYMDFLPNTISKINSVVSAVRITFCVVPIVLIAIILLFNLKQLNLLLKYIGISLLACGILFIGINLFVKINMNISSLGILNQATSDVIITVVKDLLRNINIIGIIGFIIGILCSILGTTYTRE